MFQRPRRLLSALFLVVSVASSLGSVARADVELPMVNAPAPRVRVDGWLREWNAADLATVGVAVHGRVRIAFAPAAAGLYIAASVDDDHVVRTPRPSMSEDALVVTLAAPNADGALVTTEITLFAGVPNLAAAVLAVVTSGGTPTSPRDAAIVEMPTASGYDLEAFVPWASIPSLRDYARARASVRLHDVDAVGRAGTDVASAHASTPAEAMPRVGGTAGELLPLGSFLRAKHATSSEIELDLRGNFSGDAAPERVLVVGGTLAIVGATYAHGRDFDYADIGAVNGELHDPRSVDLDGDGCSELVLLSDHADASGTTRELRIFRFPGDRIISLFRAEIGIESNGVTLTSTWTIDAPRNGQTTLRIAQATQTGTGTRRSHTAAADSIPVLTASNGILSRTYAFGDARYTLVSEERPPEAATTTPTPTPPSSRPTSTPQQTARPTTAPPTPPARPTAPGFQSSALLAAVRRDRSIPENVQARYSLTADLAEDARPEEVHTLGRSLVIFGAGYRAGNGYYALDLGVTDPAQVTSVRAQDVTGDGKAEIWVTIRQPIGTPPTFLELLVLYRMTNEGLSQMLTAQIAIGDATRVVRNEARVVGSGRSLQLALAPGTATGFDARTFPFGTTATSGMTTLLLPWRDHEARYRWNGTAMVGP